MAADPGVFEAFYASPLQHPGLLWLAAAAGTAVALSRLGLDRGLRRFCLLLGILSATDAWLTTAQVPGLGALPPALAGVVPLFFVLAGDLRYLLVVTAGTPTGALGLSARSIGTAVALTLIVPVTTQLAMSVWPALGNPRVMFLFYEICFFLLTLGLMRWPPSARSIPWIRSVSRFVLLYYGLWATADAIILGTGSDLGYLVRVMPNVLYYGGLIGVIGHFGSKAPQSG